MDFLFNGFMDYIICYVEFGMDLILSDLLITLCCYVEFGMDLLFSCLVSYICCVLNGFCVLENKLRHDEFLGIRRRLHDGFFKLPSLYYLYTTVFYKPSFVLLIIDDVC